MTILTASAASTSKQEPGTPDFDAALNTIGSVTRSGYPNSPAAWSRGADRLHALAAEVLPHAAAAAQNSSSGQVGKMTLAVTATTRARPLLASVEHVIVLASQLRALIQLLQQGSEDAFAEEVARTVASGTYTPGSYVTQRRLAQDFDAPPDLVGRAVTVLVDMGVLERAGRRGLRVTVPGQPYRSMPEYIAQRLRERIVAGVYRTGQALPSQPKLAEEFGSSPSSVSKAVADLRAEGLVARSGGRIRVVIPPRPRSPHHQITR